MAIEKTISRYKATIGVIGFTTFLSQSYSIKSYDCVRTSYIYLEDRRMIDWIDVLMVEEVVIVECNSTYYKCLFEY